MGITTNGLSVIAANMTGSALPTHIAVGTGSRTYASGLTTLVAEKCRNFIDSVDLATPKQVTLIANFNPVIVSGLVIKEFGTMTTGSVMLNYNVFTGSLVFTGEQELQVQQIFKFFISGT
jgi:hypothetical protein